MAPVKILEGEKPRKKGSAESTGNKHKKNHEQAADTVDDDESVVDLKPKEKKNHQKGDSAKRGLDEEELDQMLANDSSAIRELVSLIPPIHYKAPDADRQLSLSLKYMKKAGNTVSEKVERAKKNRKKGKFNPDSTGESDEKKAEDSDEAESDQDSSEADESNPAADSKPSLAATTRVKSVAELRARLQARILQIRGGRPLPTDAAEDGGEGKKRKREERNEEKKKKKKKEKEAKQKSTVPTPSPMPKDKGHGPKASEEDVVISHHTPNTLALSIVRPLCEQRGRKACVRGPKCLVVRMRERSLLRACTLVCTHLVGGHSLRERKGVGGGGRLEGEKREKRGGWVGT
jgi:hypothetical protein